MTPEKPSLWPRLCQPPAGSCRRQIPGHRTPVWEEDPQGCCLWVAETLHVLSPPRLCAIPEWSCRPLQRSPRGRAAWVPTATGAGLWAAPRTPQLGTCQGAGRGPLAAGGSPACGRGKQEPVRDLGEASMCRERQRGCRETPLAKQSGGPRVLRLPLPCPPHLPRHPQSPPSTTQQPGLPRQSSPCPGAAHAPRCPGTRRGMRQSPKPDQQTPLAARTGAI